jgi:hypothetical protein
LRGGVADEAIQRRAIRCARKRWIATSSLQNEPSKTFFFEEKALPSSLTSAA